MFICNVKINGKKIWKITLVLITILIISLMIFVFSKIITSNKNSENTTETDVLEITSSSYTSFLKDCHENIDNYIGKNIRIVGYVYRLPDFTSNEFVIARTMVIDNNSQAVVVGILSQCASAPNYETGSWVDVSGCIKRGNYNGEVPVLEISNITTIKAPNDEFVYLPKEQKWGS